MSAALYLGVDGGGSKTRFAVIGADGALLAEAQLGTTYHPQVGLDGVRATLADGVGQVLAQLRRTPDDVAQAFFGLPAYGEDSRATAALQGIPAQVLGHGRYACDNDMVCGWAGSLACADGINIIAGTGSMGYGRRGAAAARCGGWGEAFSDEGSAYWIAIQGLNAFSRMSDGRLPRGPLHALLRAHFQLGDHDLDICAHVYGDGVGTRGDLARLSPLVARAAQAGDAVAAAIFARAGQELAAIAVALHAALGFEAGEPVPVSYSGGAFSAGELLMHPFRTALAAAERGFELRAPLHAPHYGAALYARQLAGVPSR
ncbi:N-acetylglucosamine kinase [Xanthomonas sp. AM6]|uniref:N-acetylglucosamine kinase n=1 Tax=Xanthomonas sp. AM6 TaxID=2982531 RepID=UPI0021D84979|nr:BadF/BadG/BcrA/BcrD ATPase family protein [Xanthomonas sp. AM6]UYB51601.1 N-acetylglucosamine kinase [Xanthomonas sp. AM6]